MCSSSFGSEVESFALPKAPEQVWESTASPKKTHLASASKGVPLPGVETRVQQYRIHLLNGSTSAVSRGKLDGCQLHLFQRLDMRYVAPPRSGKIVDVVSCAEKIE